jgi:hypothetical protein
MTSVLKVDNIQNSSGTQSMEIASNGFVIPPSGGIIQIQHEQLVTSAVSQSITLNTSSVVNNFPTVNITPNSTSSKIKIECQWHGEFGNEASETNHMFFFYRDSTKLGNTTGDSNTYIGIAPASVTYKADTTNNSSTGNILYMSYFDEPNTTSQITYKLGFVSNATQTLYINRNVSGSNANNFERGTSFISATEIAG